MSYVAVITGGSGGIGRATAIKFASNGFKVIITYRSRHKEAERTVRDSLKAGAPEAYAIYLDVTDPASIEAFAREVEKIASKVNVLVNNAGVLQVGGIRETTLEEWERTIKVNLTGPFLVTKSLISLMMKAEWASIVNVSSIAGETGNVVAGVAYSASKAGLIGFTKRLAVELAPAGIRVNAVAPSFVETDMVRQFIDTPEKRERTRSLHPLGIILKPEDVAEAIYFLAVPWMSRGITGHILRINAGRYT
jgi:3-oxoacyl-[acyl-carrier protein] reductase